MMPGTCEAYVRREPQMEETCRTMTYCGIPICQATADGLHDLGRVAPRDCLMDGVQGA